MVIEIAGPLLPLKAPEASFYLWPELPMDDKLFAKQLYEEENLLVLPGSFLSRQSAGINPGALRARIALVAPLDECVEGARRMANFIKKHINQGQPA